MKLTIARDTLAPALAALSRVVERRNTIPILSNILLRAEAGRLTLRATDLDIQAETGLPCEVAEAGTVTLPAHTLSDIVRKLPAEASVTLEGTGDKPAALRCGRARFTMQSLPEADFPDIATGEFSHRFALPAKDFAGALAEVEFAISTEETRYYLNGIHMHTLAGEGGRTMLRAVATDGHRLSRMELPAPAGAEGMPEVIVPRKTVAELGRMARDQDGEILIELSATKIRATVGAATLTSKLIDGTFPDYQRVIPSGNDKIAGLDADAFRQAVDRVATISSERGRAVRLALSGAGLTLSVTHPDAGSATEEMQADYNGEPIEIGFNARYLLDVVGVLGGDAIRLKLLVPGAPAIFQRRQDDGLLVVLMPMRV